MFASKESFTSQSQEIAHLANESHKNYILQEGAPKTIESATKESIEKYAQVQAQDFLHESRALPAHEAEHIVLRLRPESHDKKIEEILGIMNVKGIKSFLP